MARSKKKIIFELYIAGQSPHSLMALVNLKQFCEKYLAKKYTIKIIDLMRHPEIAKQKNILAIPTIIKVKPNPSQRIIGDCSNESILLDKLSMYIYDGKSS